jgi:hypothetical protein
LAGMAFQKADVATVRETLGGKSRWKPDRLYQDGKNGHIKGTGNFQSLIPLLTFKIRGLAMAA